MKQFQYVNCCTASWVCLAFCLEFFGLFTELNGMFIYSQLLLLTNDLVIPYAKYNAFYLEVIEM